MTTTTEESVLENEAELREDDEVEGEGQTAETEGEEGDPAVVEEDEGKEGEPKTTEGEATTGEEATPAAAADTAKPAGVLSKDGKGVLPYAALKGARNETKIERQGRIAAQAEVDRLTQEVADLKAGKKPDVDGLTPEQIEELQTDFPSMAPLLAQVQKDREELKALRKPTAAAPAAAKPADDGDPLQDDIDTVPMLAGWQAAAKADVASADALKFARAIDIDRALVNSPKWKGKPQAERFQHVTRMVAEEFDIPLDEPGDEPSAKPSPNPNTKPNTAKKDPAEVIRNAARAAPNTLSDFKGGAPDTRDAIERLPMADQVERMSKMSDAEIDAYLAKFG